MADEPLISGANGKHNRSGQPSGCYRGGGKRYYLDIAAPGMPTSWGMNARYFRMDEHLERVVNPLR